MKYVLDPVQDHRARRIVLSTRLSARDAIHLAIARRRGVSRILTFDRGFDGLADVVRYAG